MGEIHQLGVVPDAMPKPNDKIIEIARKILRDAKSGKIQGLAYTAAVYDTTSPENKQTTENDLDFTSGWYFAMRAAIQNLGYRIERYAWDGVVDLEDKPLTDEDE